MTRAWSVTVKGEHDQQAWRELVERLPWESARSAPQEADRFVYRVRCGHKQAVVPERRFTGAWEELLNKVREADDGGIP